MLRKRTFRLSVALLVVLLSVSPLAGAQEKVKITLWHHWSLTDLVDEILQNFMAKYPWIEVESNFSSTAGAADRLGTMLVAGSAPEVIMLRSTYAFQFISLGGFLALDELAARDNIDLDKAEPRIGSIAVRDGAGGKCDRALAGIIGGGDGPTASVVDIRRARNEHAVGQNVWKIDRYRIVQ